MYSRCSKTGLSRASRWALHLQVAGERWPLPRRSSLCLIPVLLCYWSGSWHKLWPCWPIEGVQDWDPGCQYHSATGVYHLCISHILVALSYRCASPVHLPQVSSPFLGHYAIMLPRPWHDITFNITQLTDISFHFTCKWAKSEVKLHSKCCLSPI